MALRPHHNTMFCICCSTVGALLAEKLSCKFYDADAYHTAANIS
jgi:gluconate kinase